MSSATSPSSARNQTTSPPPSLSSPRLTTTATTTTPSAHTLPSSREHITDARRAVVASISNMLDTSLQPRASILHENAAALDKQEKDVIAATAALRRETEKLEKEARKASRKIKETGSVQNWAEVLEREFLVLEDTMRLVREGSGSCSCSCSDCGDSGDEFVKGDKGKEDDGDIDMMGSMSDASRSLMEPASSEGTSKAPGYDTASMSTTS